MFNSVSILFKVWFSNRRAKMRKQEGSHEEENTAQTGPKQVPRQPLHSSIIPPSNINYIQNAFSVQSAMNSESVSHSHLEQKPHLTELRPVAESTLGHIPNIFIPSTQQNGYEIITNSNSSFLTPSPQSNAVFTIGMPVSTSAKIRSHEDEDSIINIKTETPPDTPACETTISFSSKSDLNEIDSTAHSKQSFQCIMVIDECLDKSVVSSKINETTKEKLEASN